MNVHLMVRIVVRFILRNECPFNGENIELFFLFPWHVSEWNTNVQQRNPAHKKAGVTQMTRILSLVREDRLILMITMWRKSL